MYAIYQLTGNHYMMLTPRTYRVRREDVRRNFLGKDQIPIDTAENCTIKISKLAKFENDTSEAFEDVPPESRELSFKDVCLVLGGKRRGRTWGKSGSITIKTCVRYFKTSSLLYLITNHNIVRDKLLLHLGAKFRR